MAKKVARYSVTYGLSGCYMPDSNSGALEFSTRNEFADYIRHELKFFEMPASLFKEVNIKRLWQAIQRHGSSSLGFTLHHKGNALQFHGLTDHEFNEMQEGE